MSFFDEMKESLVSAGKDVSQKAKEVSGDTPSPVVYSDRSACPYSPCS